VTSATASASIPARRPSSALRRLGRIGLYVALLAFAVFYIIPVYLLLMTGMKTFGEAANVALMWQLPQAASFDSFAEAWREISPNFMNSVLIAVPAAVLSSMLGSLNGYILAKWRFRGSETLFTLILFGMFIPYQSILIPLVKFMQAINLYGDLPGLVFVNMIYGIPITTLIFRNYYAGIGTEVLEAGKIDGASLMGLYRYIIFPLSAPSFAVVIIWQFTQAWNEFLFAVILTNQSHWPVTVALNNLAGSQLVQWNVLMAATLLAALPTLLVYIFLGRYFLRGLMAGALKG
jgi:glucose/mannose transport system permease protein